MDIGGAEHRNSLRFFIVAHQTAVRKGVPNKANKVAVFDNLIVQKNHVDIHGFHYPRDGVSFDYGLNDYVKQYRDLNYFMKNLLEKIT